MIFENDITFFSNREVERLFQVSRSTVYEYVRLGILPPKVHFGSKRFFVAAEIRAIFFATVKGASIDDLKALVQELAEKRR